MALLLVLRDIIPAKLPIYLIRRSTAVNPFHGYFPCSFTFQTNNLLICSKNTSPSYLNKREGVTLCINFLAGYFYSTHKPNSQFRELGKLKIGTLLECATHL